MRTIFLLIFRNLFWRRLFLSPTANLNDLTTDFKVRLYNSCFTFSRFFTEDSLMNGCFAEFFYIFCVISQKSVFFSKCYNFIRLIFFVFNFSFHCLLVSCFIILINTLYFHMHLKLQILLKLVRYFVKIRIKSMNAIPYLCNSNKLHKSKINNSS